jgi:hypothetical protein
MKVTFISISRYVLRGLSRFLMFLGGLVFFIGDRALHEFEKVSYPVALAIGIFSGLLLMGLGVLVGSAGEAVKPDQD